MFGRWQSEIDGLLARIVSVDDRLMTALPRIGGLEGQYTSMNQKINVLETRVDREFQRRRLVAEMEQAGPAPAPAPSHRGLGALPGL